MKNKKQKENNKRLSMKIKLIYLFLIIQPFLDLITSIMVRYIDFPITIGMVFRGLFVLLSLIYLLFLCKSKYRKKSLIYLLGLFFFCLIYFITKPDILNLGFLKTELINLFKYLYFPIATISLINMVDEFKIEREKVYKILILNVTIYALLIIVPEFTNTSFSSYLDSNKGSVGWFFAANEIGAIMVALFSFLYYLIYKNERILKILFIFIVVIVAMTVLGTKTSFIGMVITEIIFSLYFLLTLKKDKGKGMKISIIIILLSFVLIPNIPAVSNLKTAISSSNNIVEEKSSDLEEETDELVKKYYSKNTTMQRVVKIAFSGRDKFFITTLDIYKKAPLDDKIFGMGFVNREEIDNKRIEKLIEIDPLDIFFHYGIVGFIIIFMPLVAIMLKILKLFIKNRKELTFFNVTEFYVIGIITLVSMIAGHIYGAPSVSIYIALCLALLVNNNSKTKEKTTLK